MRRLIACLLLFGMFGAPSALAEKRVALVIGNDTYLNLAAQSQLQKAVADARAVRDVLLRLGFDVGYGENEPLGRTKQLFFEFSAKLSEGDIAFVYYAGHGVALAGANYLVPTDIPTIKQPDSEADIRDEEDRLAEFAISEAFVIQRIKARGARVGVVVIDACRDNPLRVAEAANPFRSTRPGDLVFGSSRGLALVQSRPEGIVSVYSANFGQRALDRLGPNDSNPNSPFTRVFVKHLATPGKGLRTVMLDTREEVFKLARGIGVEQRPGIYDEMTGDDLFLAGKAPAKGAEETAAVPDKVPEAPPQTTIAVPAVPIADIIASDYVLAERVGTSEAWDVFLAKHGSHTDNFHVQLARASKQKLAAIAEREQELAERERAQSRLLNTNVPTPANRFPTFSSEFANTVGPSFDCGKAATVAEQLLCSDSGLARVDGIMGLAYQKLRSMLPAASAKKLRADQRAWILQRDQRCGITRSMLTSEPQKAMGIQCLLEASTERSLSLIRQLEVARQ